MGRCLAAAGGSFDDVVKLTWFVTDVAFNDGAGGARRVHRHLPAPSASTVVQVVALYRPDLLLEVDALALLEDA